METGSCGVRRVQLVVRREVIVYQAAFGRLRVHQSCTGQSKEQESDQLLIVSFSLSLISFMIASRFRAALFLFLLVLVPTAYWLRFKAPFTGTLRDASGGAAYVIFWSAFAMLLRPFLSIWKVVLWVLALTCTLEVLQLWHPAWLEAIRRTLPGRLVLGTTFDPFDFPPYFAGAAIALPLLWLFSLAARDRRL